MLLNVRAIVASAVPTTAVLRCAVHYTSSLIPPGLRARRVAGTARGASVRPAGSSGLRCPPPCASSTREGAMVLVTANASPDGRSIPGRFAPHAASASPSSDVISMAAAPSSTTSSPVRPRWMVLRSTSSGRAERWASARTSSKPRLAVLGHGSDEHDVAGTERADHRRPAHAPAAGQRRARPRVRCRRRRGRPPAAPRG